MNDLTVIIPCYNAEKYLDNLANNLLNQQFDNYKIKIVFINDASSDDTLELLKILVNSKVLKAKYQLELKSCDSETPLGTASARNLGMENLNSKYVTFLDADDTIDLNYFAEIKKVADNNAGVIICNHKSVMSKQIIAKQLTKSYNPADSLLFAMVCSKVYKSEKIIKFHSDQYFEDIVYVFEFFAQNPELNVEYANTNYIINRENTNSKMQKINDYQYFQAFLIVFKQYKQFPVALQKGFVETFVGIYGFSQISILLRFKIIIYTLVVGWKHVFAIAKLGIRHSVTVTTEKR